MTLLRPVVFLFAIGAGLAAQSIQLAIYGISLSPRQTAK
jgi:hypothetical protein